MKINCLFVVNIVKTRYQFLKFINSEMSFKYNRLKRPLRVLELIQIQKMFCYNRGYKDLIRDFKADFNVELDKPTAKRFLVNRSWSEVLEWLTGEKIVPPDAKDTIPQLERKHYELLEHMIEQNREDEQERQQQLKEFEQQQYFFNENVKYFNFPLYGEIITYKYKEPFMKCFLINPTTGKIVKIEDVPISEDMPDFLLRIIRKINNSKILTNKTFKEQLEDNMKTHYYITQEQAEQEGIKDIFNSDLFKQYNFTYKE